MRTLAKCHMSHVTFYWPYLSTNQCACRLLQLIKRYQKEDIIQIGFTLQ